MNVLKTDLIPCSYDPLTGYFRDGCCKEAFDAGVAPPVVLASTHARALDIVSLEQLQRHAYKSTI